MKRRIYSILRIPILLIFLLSLYELLSSWDQTRHLLFIFIPPQCQSGHFVTQLDNSLRCRPSSHIQTNSPLQVSSSKWRSSLLSASWTWWTCDLTTFRSHLPVWSWCSIEWNWPRVRWGLSRSHSSKWLEVVIGLPLMIWLPLLVLCDGKWEKKEVGLDPDFK